MRRVTGLFATVMGAAALLLGQDQARTVENKGVEMTGYLCNAKCVKQEAGKAACDLSCHETAKDKVKNVVFIDDQGKVTEVLNPSRVRSGMGKKVKLRGEMKKRHDKDMMEVYSLLSIFG